MVPRDEGLPEGTWEYVSAQTVTDTRAYAYTHTHTHTHTHTSSIKKSTEQAWKESQ